MIRMMVTTMIQFDQREIRDRDYVCALCYLSWSARSAFRAAEHGIEFDVGRIVFPRELPNKIILQSLSYVKASPEVGRAQSGKVLRPCVPEGYDPCRWTPDCWFLARQGVARDLQPIQIAKYGDGDQLRLEQLVRRLQQVFHGHGLDAFDDFVHAEETVVIHFLTRQI